MTPESELAGFVDKFAPPMQDLIRGCRTAMRARFPDAVEMVYDNYNFFVIGYGPTRRPSEAIFSLAADRHGVRLCFLQRGPELPDPGRLLRGTGNVVRSVPLAAAGVLDQPAVDSLVTAALDLAAVPMDVAEGPDLIIKSVSAKQRPRQG